MPHMKNTRAGAVVALAIATATAHAQPFAVGGDPRVDASRFRITTFASGLSFPSSMTTLADDSLLVATNVPNAGGSFFNSTGVLRRFVDADSDGVAEQSSVLASGLPGGLSSVRRAGDLIFAQSATGTLSVLRGGTTPGAPLTSVGAINFANAGFLHATYALAVSAARPDGSYDLYFNVGSKLNEANTTATVALSGLVSATLQSESIYRVNVRDASGGAGTPTFGAPEQIAKGLRNAAGITVAPNGDLYFQDNGIDTPSNVGEAFSADELNRIGAADLGGAVEDFGFADTYIAYRTGAKVGTRGVDPLVAFTPLPNAATGSEAEGASEIALAPAGFPSWMQGQVFVGFHGQFNDGGLVNAENPLALANPATGGYFQFVGNDEANVGHLDGLLATGNTLFAADLATTGDLFATPTNGALYAITYVPEPASLSTLAFLAAATLLRRRDRNRPVC